MEKVIDPKTIIQDYILLKAYTNSDWDSVTFALLPADKKRLEYLLYKHEQAQNTPFDECVLYSNDIEFFNNDLPDDVKNQYGDFNEEHSGKLVKHSNADIYGLLARPEQDIRYGKFMFNKVFQWIRYAAYGKHTGEEFSVEISIEDIKSAISKL